MSLHTLSGRCEHAIEVKKSRFLAIGVPASSVELAMAFLASEHRADASHHCWAYRVGQAYRFQDDGEPSGSAGRPILSAIDGQALDEVVVLVMRWFGDAKLGVGGLVRAYGGCAAEALRKADKTPCLRYLELDVTCDFALASAVHALLDSHGAEKLSEQFDSAGVTLRLQVPDTRSAALCQSLRDASRGEIQIHVNDQNPAPAT